MVKTVGKFDLFHTIGKGTFGKVKYGVNKETNTSVAVKYLSKDKIHESNMVSQIKREISIVRRLKHPNIVNVQEVFATATKIFIVMEYVSGGELFSNVAKGGKLPEEHARYYFAQLVEAIVYCHSVGVCHRDLKPENILVNKHGVLKLSDFGLAAIIVREEFQPEGKGASGEEGDDDASLLYTTCGTPNYIAPEVIAKRGYDGKTADCWSMGVILYVLLAGFLPFNEKSLFELFQKISQADYLCPPWFSEDALLLVEHVLVVDPMHRMTAVEMRLHPWVVAEGEGTKPASMATESDDDTVGAASSTGSASLDSASVGSRKDLESEAFL